MGPFQPEEIQSYLGIENLISGLVGREPTVVGWGRTNADQLATFDGLSSKAQQKLQVPILSLSECSAMLTTLNLRESQVCAGGVAGQDSCRGDSGGGLFIQDKKDKKDKDTPWYLVGIVSFGSRNCGNGRPGIYTRVSS